MRVVRNGRLRGAAADGAAGRGVAGPAECLALLEGVTQRGRRLRVGGRQRCEQHGRERDELAGEAACGPHAQGPLQPREQRCDQRSRFGALPGQRVQRVVEAHVSGHADEGRRRAAVRAAARRRVGAIVETQHEGRRAFDAMACEGFRVDHPRHLTLTDQAGDGREGLAHRVGLQAPQHQDGAAARGLIGQQLQARAGHLQRDEDAKRARGRGLCGWAAETRASPGKCFDVGGCRSGRQVHARRRGHRLSTETIGLREGVGFLCPLDVLGIGPARRLGERDAGGEQAERAGSRGDGADLSTRRHSSSSCGRSGTRSPRPTPGTTCRRPRPSWCGRRAGSSGRRPSRCWAPDRSSASCSRSCP